MNDVILITVMHLNASFIVLQNKIFLSMIVTNLYNLKVTISESF